MARGSLSALDGDRRQHLLVNPAIELSDGPQVLQSLDQDSRERDTPGLRVWQLRGRSGHPGAAGACLHLWFAIEIQHRLRSAGTVGEPWQPRLCWGPTLDGRPQVEPRSSNGCDSHSSSYLAQWSPAWAKCR